jgi:hypothetical protein
VWTIRAWRRETVGSSKRTLAARLRPIRVQSPVRAATHVSPSASAVGQQAVALVVDDQWRAASRGAEQRCADEGAGAAVGAVGQAVDGCQRQYISALLTPKRAGRGDRS